MRILYGVMCEGMGHAVRSSVVRDHLVSRGHEVTFACGNSRASKFLSKYGPVARTPCFSTGTKNGRFNLVESIKNMPNVAVMNLSPLFLAGLPRPDVVFTDFEPCVARYAKAWGISLVCLDNIHFMDRCAHPHAVATDRNRAISDILVTRGVAPDAQRYMVTTFVNAPIRLPRTSLHMPILRPNTAQACQSDHGSIVVYFNDLANWPAIVSALKKLSPVKFRCYGSPTVGVDGNVTLCGVSDQLLEDLACAKAVIGGAGFTFMTECIYTHKPLLTIPFDHNFEQTLNANYLQALGYGQRCSSLTSETVGNFLDQVPTFARNLSSVEHDGNAELFSELDRMLG
jgi:uncharacterized protein (TIGR00661 family)